jgi:hypothetical protein
MADQHVLARAAGCHRVSDDERHGSRRHPRDPRARDDEFQGTGTPPLLPSARVAETGGYPLAVGAELERGRDAARRRAAEYAARDSIAQARADSAAAVADSIAAAVRAAVYDPSLNPPVPEWATVVGSLVSRRYIVLNSNCWREHILNPTFFRTEAEAMVRGLHKSTACDDRR